MAAKLKEFGIKSKIEQPKEEGESIRLILDTRQEDPITRQKNFDGNLDRVKAYIAKHEQAQELFQGSSISDNVINFPATTIAARQA